MSSSGIRARPTFSGFRSRSGENGMVEPSIWRLSRRLWEARKPRTTSPHIRQRASGRRLEGREPYRIPRLSPVGFCRLHRPAAHRRFRLCRRRSFCRGRAPETGWAPLRRWPDGRLTLAVAGTRRAPRGKGRSDEAIKEAHRCEREVSIGDKQNKRAHRFRRALLARRYCLVELFRRRSDRSSRCLVAVCSASV